MTTVATDVLQGAVRLACRAPSYHNSQPWRWVADREGLHLFLDPTRVVQTDPTERQALISCGAALDHLCVATRATGWKADVRRCPDPDNVEHLASITFTEMPAVTEEQRRRADAIVARRTDRLPFGPIPDWANFEAKLRSRIDSTVALLDVINDADRQRLAYATELTDSLRLYDSFYFETLQRWTAPFEASEGIPYDSLVSAAEAERVDVARSFPVSHHAERRVQTPSDLSTIVVLSSHADTRRDLLGCGETLSTVLLEATVAGLATCTLTHLTELATSRHLIEVLTGHPRPQVLIRIGRAPDNEHRPPPTPRRPLADVLTINLSEP
ncbi:Acg family FMN-binding oxidoreductase [Mycobacterium sherrisii]|uniref:NAD(P)H nitroreductase n=1 Tax=Mycobacterium sherrisii TaxID=243061 RepID=A0A1E3SN32_9MYCO|nr:NAD(P)H nitroreductase [Mycobacterium sherrisii]MCV7031073.1 NAD(P)H nitroreductase [Mycobacterium sherrisii]ODR03541.1 NAD(P)H nitroreductase [Mycobacterium sherrisii]ORW72051.1 NAD(P)H nitroreductase [Mycobacterium sherrisii]